MRWCRFGGWLVGVSLLSGCVNLEAVRTYTDAASDVVGNTQPAARWRDSEKSLVALRLDGDRCPIGRPGRLPQQRFDQAFDEAAVVHKALAEYFDALGALAVDELPKTEKTAGTSLDAIQRAGVGVSDQQRSAVLSLFKLLDRGFDAYRHTKLRELMQETHADVATILDLLQRLADVYAGEVRSEGIQATKFVECSIGQKDLADAYLGRRELRRVADHYAAEEQAIARYKAALGKIAADHEKIRDALSMSGRKQVESTLRAIGRSAKELRAATQALSAL